MNGYQQNLKLYKQSKVMLFAEDNILWYGESFNFYDVSNSWDDLNNYLFSSMRILHE